MVHSASSLIIKIAFWRRNISSDSSTRIIQWIGCVSSDFGNSSAIAEDGLTHPVGNVTQERENS